MAEYQSLYRKYRPQGPLEVLGQEHVVRALMGSVREGRLAHAFLFCGPRGTGKTSTARILAKMVNCEQGPTAEPCGACEQCLAIREGQHLDVVEIDAASHGGVDDARDLREKAPTAPVQGREKVYIIDEAQRLSREAFDALLKVFEEPPPGVRFVLATTEPHKMPATIIGRCQRFDFRRGAMDVVADHLLRVANDEGIEVTRGAAQAMARQSEGSFRDALSLLDQVSVLGAGTVDEGTVASLIGVGRSDVMFALADAVSVGDARGVFEVVNGIVQEGQDLRHVTSEALAHFRNLLLVKTAPGQHDLIDATESEVERLSAQAAKLSEAELARIISLLLDAQTDMRWTTSPRLSLELALVRATMPETDANPAALISRLERLERISGIEVSGGGAVAPGLYPRPGAGTGETASATTVPDGDSGSPSATAPEPAPSSGRTEKPKPRRAAKTEPEPSEATPSAAASTGQAPSGPASTPSQPVVGAGTSAVDVAMIRGNWQGLISELRSQGKAVLPSFLEIATPASFDGETLELVFPPDRKFGVAKVEEREGELRDALVALFGVSPKIRCVVREPVAGVVEIPEEDPPLSEEEALARLTAELGAKPAEQRDEG
ncbi:MAG TPA: DNA polymerase III subunit gamma/tau [Actinomycetota bacterium]|nr:DNA polymerase III subunit gamma/tau [Actinomycetota bacterium]